MTESQKAFEARFKQFDFGLNNSGQYRNDATYSAYKVFEFGLVEGRKQALEEAIAVARVEEYGGTNVQAAAVRIGKAIKELLK